ncbi:hypothetical protein [Bernardetia sp. MNP-M8]|uniref:hypothetical protein n=1 Tax=Bernardetia sp. MNP-M8 TaxID=3127470 RepID=UPI0030CCAF3A
MKLISKTCFVLFLVFSIYALTYFLTQELPTFSSREFEIDAKKTLRIEFVADTIFEDEPNQLLNKKPITEQLEIYNFISQINKSEPNSMWKGVGWDKVMVFQKDTTLILYTNGKIIGANNSGWFYNLSKNSLLSKRYISK